jgi:hypothetical protein
MTPGWESDYGFQMVNYTPVMRFRKDPNGNFWGPDAGGVAGIRWRIAALRSQLSVPDRSRRPGWKLASFRTIDIGLERWNNGILE